MSLSVSPGEECMVGTPASTSAAWTAQKIHEIIGEAAQSFLILLWKDLIQIDRRRLFEMCDEVRLGIRAMLS
jgi:hypothetical protein